MEFKMIVEICSTSPDSQMSERLRDKCKTLLDADPSEAECYDLLGSISKESCFMVAERISIGEISSFIRELCNVSKYYERPEE